MQKVEYTKSTRQYQGCNVQTIVELCDGKTISETITDRALYDYQEWRDRFYNGLITKDTLDLILKFDGLERFIRAGDLIIKPDADAQYAKTKAFESTWYGALAAREKSSDGYKNMLADIINGF